MKNVLIVLSSTLDHPPLGNSILLSQHARPSDLQLKEVSRSSLCV
jgi:hypothetical protein